MKDKIIPFIALVLIAIVVIIATNGKVSLGNKKQSENKIVTNFDECAAEDNAIMESYPRQCISKAGDHFVEEVKEFVNDEVTSTDLIIGQWQSNEDKKFVRAFIDKQVVVDFYDNEQTGGIGNWDVLSDDQLTGLPFPTEEGEEYIVIIFNEETLFFKLVEVTDTKLDLLYTDGGMLSFSRIPELI